MAEPLKNLFSVGVITQMAGHLHRTSKNFDQQEFLKHALKDLDSLELMQRSEQIISALHAAYSSDFQATVGSMLAALHPHTKTPIGDLKMDAQGIAHWPVMPLAGFVTRYGLQVPEFSLNALREMTTRFTSEFAVRPFFRDHPTLTLEMAKDWARCDNDHIRRLASEGSRPRLPWGIRLHDFVRDPSQTMPILETLRDDPSEYVRRSVANHLNDIAKDHGDFVADVASDWLVAASPDRQRLVKHACRSLIKQGHSGALAAFGFDAPDIADCRVRIDRDSVALGESIQISLDFTAISGPQKLLVDYVVHYMRANGKLSPKVFKWCEIDVRQGQVIAISKLHHYRKVTTRKDYPGNQMVSVQINGKTVGSVDFDFVC